MTFPLPNETKLIIEQSAGITEQFMLLAYERINEKKGMGFSEINPEIVSGFMNSCAQLYSAAIVEERLKQVCGELDSLHDMLISIRKDLITIQKDVALRKKR